MKTKQAGHTPTQHLDNVCIVQKYNDSNKVLECRESFNQSYQFIVKAVNNHQSLYEACQEALEWMEEYYRNSGDEERRETMHLIEKALKGVENG